jgi:hypothetical protein
MSTQSCHPGSLLYLGVIVYTKGQHRSLAMPIRGPPSASLLVGRHHLETRTLRCGRTMALSHRFLSVVILGLILTLGTGTWADDAVWTGIVERPFFDATILSVSVLSLKGENGLQLAIVSGLMGHRSAKRLSLGIGYDDMVTPFQNFLDGTPRPVHVTEQVFLFQTSCDKRFQLTLQLRW